MNFTKVIDYDNCTGLNYDIFNKAAQGPNPEQDRVSCLCLMFNTLSYAKEQQILECI